MKITIKTERINDAAYNAIVTTPTEQYERVYENTNAVYPTYRELINVARKNRGTTLNVETNIYSLVKDLQILDTLDRRLAVILKDTLKVCDVKIGTITLLK